MSLFLYGMIFGASIASSLFFFNFWRRTKDQLFLLFGLSFALLAVERLVLAFLDPSSEYKCYLIRLAAFVLILVAIIQKNRGKR